MPLACAPPLALRDGDKEWLEAVLRRPSSNQQEVLRAGIVLLCAEGLSHRQIQRQLHTSADTIARWRGRYESRGLEGLKGLPRSGKAVRCLRVAQAGLESAASRG
jgi:hypothetical protein